MNICGYLKFLCRSHNTWEDASNIAHCREIIAEFKEHRIQEGFDDSDDEVPIISPPQKKRKPRKRKGDDSGDQGTSVGEQSSGRRRSTTQKNKNPRLAVNLSNASEIVAASYSESGKFFCVQFMDESKYWVSNEECRKHLPQLLLDFYENCSVFMESESPKEKQKPRVSKKKSVNLNEEKIQNSYVFHDQLESSSSILDQYPENDETELIIEEAHFDQEVSFLSSENYAQSNRNLIDSEFLEPETAGLS